MLDDLLETLFDDAEFALKGSKRAQVIWRIFFGALGVLLSAAGVWQMLFRLQGGLHLRLCAAFMFGMLAAFCFCNVCLLKKWRWPGVLFAVSFGMLFILRIVFGR